MLLKIIRIIILLFVCSSISYAETKRLHIDEGVIDTKVTVHQDDDGSIVRWGWTITGEEVFVYADYPPEHEVVLGEVVNVVWKNWEDYKITNMLKRKKTPENGDIACGTSADAMQKKIKPLLPEGWETYSIDSVDVTNFWDSNPLSSTNGYPGSSGTAHTITAIRAPDGTVYALDAYFFGPELAKMRVATDKNGEVLYCDEKQYLFCTSSPYLNLMLNSNYAFRKASQSLTKEEMNYLDPSKKMITGYEKLPKHPVSFRSSYDPNEIYGPSGIGSEKYVSQGEILDYGIAFENKPTASLPAATVQVTEHIDSLVYDLSAFSFGEIKFGNYKYTPGTGLQDLAADVDLRPSKNLIVRVVGHLDTSNSTVSWTFTSIDPDTNLPPDDPTLGFLPPNITSPDGEGIVNYQIKCREDIASGSKLASKASIVFDNNPAIETPVWTNILDCGKPVSDMDAVQAIQPFTAFNVKWTGDDDYSGVGTYTIYYSIDGGAFERLISTNEKSIPFKGTKGRTYSFYVVVTDQVGNIEDHDAVADITTKISETADELDIRMDSLKLSSVSKISPTVWDCDYKLKMSNLSTVALTETVARIVSDNDAFKATDSTISFGTINANSTATPSDIVRFRIDYDKVTAGTSTDWTVDFKAAGSPFTYHSRIVLDIPDNSLPAVAISGPSVSLSKNGPVSYIVTYTGADTIALDASKVLLNKTGTASGTVEVAPRSQLTKTVTIKNITGDGNLGITISAGSATNVSGPSLAAGPSPVFRADNTGPVVNVTFPVSTPEITRNGKTIKLAGTASDSSGLDKIACGTAAGLTDCTGTATWTSSVVAIGDGTTNVSVKATDQLGNMSTKNIPVTYIESSPDEGWNGLSMVSLPVIPDYTDPKLTVAFSNNYWLAYLPSSNSYIKYGSSGLNSKLCWFEPRDSAIGKGYWALFTGTVPVPTGTVPKQTSAVKIHLYPGWNLIGLPFISEVKWDLSALQVESGSIIKSLADSANIVLNHGWGWDTVKKEYYLVYDNSILSTVAGYLKPWQGYWVKAFAECNLVITPQAVQQ